MLENFIYAKQKSLFEEALNNGEVLDEAIVFIEDTKEIWNHGTYFNGNTIPTKISQLENDVPYVVDDVLLPENGLYIYDTDGNFTLPDNWDTANNSEAVGVAILTDDCRFVVAKEDAKSSTVRWGGYDIIIYKLTNYTTEASAITDFDGVNNTSKIIAAIGNRNDDYRDGTVAGDCAAYIFPNGKPGYLGAAGEWQVARQNKENLNSALTLIGGTTMQEGSYWTSTEYDNYGAWRQWFDSNSDCTTYDKSVKECYVRAFLTIPIPLRERVSEIESSVSKIETDGDGTKFLSDNGTYKGTITDVRANGTSIATSGVANIPAASTSKYGVTKLSSATNSASTTLAATASAVKTTYDLAASKASKSDVYIEVEVENGVYAVTSTEELLEYDDDNIDSTCIGVALITDNQCVMIEKNETNNGAWGGLSTFYWGYNLQNKDVTGIANNNSNDFLGSQNTNSISLAYSMYGVELIPQDMYYISASFRNANYSDWYIPAIGLLQEIYNNRSKINEVLSAIQGVSISLDPYWSSTELNPAYAFYMSSSGISTAPKTQQFRIRLVRNFDTTKPLKKSLKKKVEQLESQIGDINIILESIIND